MNGELLVKILAGKKKDMMGKETPSENEEMIKKSPMENEEVETEESGSEYSDEDLSSVALRVGSEELFGEQLVNFVDQYRDKLVENKPKNYFEE